MRYKTQQTKEIEWFHTVFSLPGLGSKNPAIIKIWKNSHLTEIGSFTAFDGYYGANVATGDIDGDGIDEMITGLGPGPQNPAWVKIFKENGTEISSFLAYTNQVGYGVRVQKGRTGR